MARPTLCSHRRVTCLASQPSARVIGGGPVADALATAGSTTTLCSAPTHPQTGREVLDSFLAQLPSDQDLILVAHSNAGAYIPALSTQRSAVGAVFVDALLPPSRGDLPLAPPAFLDVLRQKVDSHASCPSGPTGGKNQT